MSSKSTRSARTARFELRRTLPVALFRAAHPSQALLVALVVTGAAALSGRRLEEVGLVLATVLVGQTILGWHNDAVDAPRDAAHARDEKPIVAGDIDRGTVSFSIAVAVLLVIPLAMANGIASGLTYLGILLIGVATNWGLLRRTVLSFLPWLATFGLFPAFLSYGGWAGDGAGGPPTIAITVSAALLGIGVHLLWSLPGLVNDNKDDSRSLPLRLGLKIGAPRLLVLAVLFSILAGAAVLVAALTVGLVQ